VLKLIEGTENGLDSFQEKSSTHVHGHQSVPLCGTVELHHAFLFFHFLFFFFEKPHFVFLVMNDVFMKSECQEFVNNKESFN
jgi:hypothetical protein